MERLEDRQLLSATVAGSTVATDQAATQQVLSASSEVVAATPLLSVLPSTPGMYDPFTSTFRLKNSLGGGTADELFAFGKPNGGWKPIVGDWAGNGTDGVGLYSQSTSTFYLKNTLEGGTADERFVFAKPNSSWIPLAGDWDGNGADTIGLYDPATSTFRLKYTLSGGEADAVFVFGRPAGGWIPIVGDWDGNGTDTIGLYDPYTSTFRLKNTLEGGTADELFVFGTGNRSWQPLTGDWTGSGSDTVGLYTPRSSTFRLKNTLEGGVADELFIYGAANSSWTPLTGVWATSSSLAAAGGGTSAASATALTQAQLQPILQEAISRWTDAGLDAATLSKLSQVQVVLSDLPGSLLGEAQGHRITIDGNAAGYGWFVDATPAQDEEFAASTSCQALHAVDAQALDRIDLLTVVEHELGHIAGLKDLDALADSLMDGVLGVGVRRSPLL
jgi:hypothetical protein